VIETISIGKIVAPFGLGGELVIRHGLGTKTALKDLKALFIEDKAGNQIPYFVSSAKAKNHEEVFVKLDGIDSREAAVQLIKKQVWLKKEDFEKYAAPAAAISLMDFMVKENGKEIGRISEIIEQPHQVLCTVMVGEKEVLIPLHEETLLGIDRKKKIVEVSLPEGLLDIYLNS
jgi:16S rRNA processing protein RimM